MKNKKVFKVLFLVIQVIPLIYIAFLILQQWLPVIIFHLNNGLLHEKTVVTDYYYFHYSFENVWHNKPSLWMYDCDALHVGVKEKYNIDLPPNACYLYPPHFAVFFSWLGSFTYDHAEYIWNILLNLLYIIGVIFFIKMIFKEKMKENYRYMITLLFMLSILNYPFLFDFHMSNSNRLTFFLIAIMFYLLYEKKKDFLAGIPLGLAIVFKITPAIILVFYLFKGRFRLALGTFFSIFFSTLIVIMTVGWNVLWKYSTEIFWGFTGKLNHFSVPYDNSIQGILSTYIPAAPIRIIFVIYILFFFFMYLYLLHKNNDEKFEIGLIALSPLVFSPHLEVHHLVLTFFAQIILVHYLWMADQKDRYYFILIAATILIFYIFSLVEFWTAKGEHFVGLMLIVFALLLSKIVRKPQIIP